MVVARVGDYALVDFDSQSILIPCLFDEEIYEGRKRRLKHSGDWESDEREDTGKHSRNLSIVPIPAMGEDKG